MSNDTTLAEVETASTIARAQLMAEYPELATSWRQGESAMLTSAFDLGFSLGARWLAQQVREDL